MLKGILGCEKSRNSCRLCYKQFHSFSLNAIGNFLVVLLCLSGADYSDRNQQNLDKNFLGLTQQLVDFVHKMFDRVCYGGTYLYFDCNCFEKRCFVCWDFDKLYVDN